MNAITTDMIKAKLPDNDLINPLIASTETEWTWNLDESSPHGTIIILTNRKLVSDGGDGNTGFDGADMRLVRNAIQTVLEENDSIGLVKTFIIRSA